jgi:hypothetical protein
LHVNKKIIAFISSHKDCLIVVELHPAHPNLHEKDSAIVCKVFFVLISMSEKAGDLLSRSSERSISELPQLISLLLCLIEPPALLHELSNTNI